MTAPPLSPLTPSARQGNWQFANSLALLILRLMVGWIFINAGAGKLFGAFGGPGMSNWTAFMQGAGLPIFPPAVWAWISAVGEFSGGLLILLGLLTRLAAIDTIVVMLFAITLSTGKNGFGGIYVPEADAVKMGYAYNLTLIAISAALVLAGPGLISLDAPLFKRSLWSRGPQPLDQPVART